MRIHNVDAFKHYVRKYAYKGLVHLVYGENQKNKFKTYEDFFRSQIMEGLKAKKKTMALAKNDELQAQKEMRMKGASAHDIDGIGTEVFDNALAEIKKTEEHFLKKFEEGKKEKAVNDDSIDIKGKDSKKA